MDVEIKNRFDNLESRFDKLEGRFDNLESRFDKLESRFDKLESRFDNLESRFDNLHTLITGLMDSFNREIGGVKDQLARMETRLDKISAGSHYVSRLVEWSEKQDQFQIDILRRVQALEQRVAKLPPQAHNG